MSDENIQKLMLSFKAVLNSNFGERELITRMHCVQRTNFFNDMIFQLSDRTELHLSKMFFSAPSAYLCNTECSFFLDSCNDIVIPLVQKYCQKVLETQNEDETLTVAKHIGKLSHGLSSKSSVFYYSVLCAS